MESAVTTSKELSSSPVTIKNILLLSSGIWNGTEYTEDEISKSFSNTDWNDKKNTHLYLDHQDTKERGVGNWAGFIRNPRLVNNSELWGDLEVWNPLIATFLKEAKAKFGISATLSGLENVREKSKGASGRMEDFHFESFSIVTDPACKPALINLSDNRVRQIVTLSKISSADLDKEIDGMELDEEDKEKLGCKIKGKGHLQNESVPDSSDTIQKEENEMNSKKLEEEKVEDKVEEAVEEKAEEPEEAKKAEAEEPKAEEKAEETVMENMMKKIEALSNIVGKISKKLEEEKPAEEPKAEPEEPEEKKEMTKIKRELSELKEEFGRPDRKTLSSSGGTGYADGNEAILSFFRNNLGY